MKRIILIGLLVVTGLTSQAQTHEYAKRMGIFFSCPQVKKDPKTNKTTAKWYATNMAWIKDYCEVENVATEKDILKIFPELPNLPDYGSYIPMSWRLTSENNETVLHCYFQMPADEVTDMWLASEETCIVDQETGAQYRIRRTEPDTYRKHFTLKGKTGDVVDLKVFFAPLAETTKEVRIYGLPNWGMMGGPVAPVTIRHEAFGTFEPLAFDTIPQLHKPGKQLGLLVPRVRDINRHNLLDASRARGHDDDLLRQQDGLVHVVGNEEAGLHVLSGLAA